MKQIFTESVNNLGSEEISVNSKIHVLTDAGKEFRISFDSIDDSIIIKEVSGDKLSLTPMATNSIRIN